MTPNPCIGICTTTAVGDDYCRGCGRYYRDVIGWNSYTDTQKRDALERRRKETK